MGLTKVTHPAVSLLRTVAVMALAALALAAFGWGGSSDSPDAAAPAATPAAPQTGLSASDLDLVNDITDSLGKISTLTVQVGSCGADSACILDINERLGNLAEGELIGLQRRVRGADLPCIRNGGGYYVLALKRYVLARDFARRGRVADATEQVSSATTDLTSAGDVVSTCSP
jgi:hypothetical protein